MDTDVQQTSAVEKNGNGKPASIPDIKHRREKPPRMSYPTTSPRTYETSIAGRSGLGSGAPTNGTSRHSESQANTDQARIQRLGRHLPKRLTP